MPGGITPSRAGGFKKRRPGVLAERGVVELLRKRGLSLKFSLGRNAIREDVIGLMKKRAVYKFEEIGSTEDLLYYGVGTLVTPDGEVVGFYATIGLFGLKGEKWTKEYSDTVLTSFT